MKKYLFTFFQVSVVFLSLLSCKKENSPEPTPAQPAPVVNQLDINPARNRYVSSMGKGYFSGTFKDIKDIQHFSLYVEKDKTYLITALIPYSPYSSIEITIFNEKKDTLLKNMDQVTFLAPATKMVFIDIKTKTTVNVDFNYQLYVIKQEPITVMWKGKKWVGYGDWTVNSAGNLSLESCSKDFNENFLMRDSILNKCSIQFEMKCSNDFLEYESLGIRVNASHFKEKNYFKNYNNYIEYYADVTFNFSNIIDVNIKDSIAGNNYFNNPNNAFMINSQVWKSLKFNQGSTYWNMTIDNTSILSYPGNSINVPVRKGYFYFFHTISYAGAQKTPASNIIEFRNFSIQ